MNESQDWDKQLRGLVERSYLTGHQRGIRRACALTFVKATFVFVCGVACGVAIGLWMTGFLP